MNSQINITPEDWDLIESYLDSNTLLDESSWEKVLPNIPNAEEKITHIKKVRAEIEDSIRLSKIKDFQKSVFNSEISKENSPTKKPISKMIWYGIAASFLLFGMFYIMEVNDAKGTIFSVHFKPDIGLPLKMGTADNYGFYEGMLEYKQGNYKDAIDQWQILWEVSPENDTLNYFLGVANLAQGNALKSLEYLENQEHFQESIFKEDAIYYSALAKIKEGDFEEAKILLNKNHSDRSKSLLNALNQQ